MRRGVWSVFLIFLILAATSAGVLNKPAQATDAAAAMTSYGVGYDRYEPTFYTGFAPRVADPRRIHIHLGRGNQVRITAVLSEDDLRVYAADLLTRARTYRALIDDGQIVLTQNDGISAFESTVLAVSLESWVAEEVNLSNKEIGERNLELLERLNPGRVFRIRMPIDEVVRRWAARLAKTDQAQMSAQDQLDLVNAMLPTRLYVRRLDETAATALKQLVAMVGTMEQPLDDAALAALRTPFVALLDDVAADRYPLVGDALVFVEFTAIHPVGSFNDYTEYRGRRIPMFPTPGRRELMTHQRTKTPDHIPTNLVYSYSPWLPYMHVGTRLHNAFHTLWWQMRPKNATFLPASLQPMETSNRDGTPYRYWWLLSRGPMSHGCTHVNVGHITEMRQILPSETDRLFDVEVFINRSHLYDVFDIDGDFEPEVMGVEYFIAYSLRNKRPHKLRAPTERRAFYDWLYGGDLRLDADGRGYFVDVKDAKFIDAKAEPGTTYHRIPLYEAAYEPERVQFFAPKPIPFIRELRRVGVRHPFAG